MKVSFEEQELTESSLTEAVANARMDYQCERCRAVIVINDELTALLLARTRERPCGHCGRSHGEMIEKRTENEKERL